MLEQLCGRIHEVLTGVCLVHRSEGKLCRFTGLDPREVCSSTSTSTITCGASTSG